MLIINTITQKYNNMKTIKLEVGTVEIVDKLTWGQQEAIRAEILGGVKMTGLTDKEKQNLELDPSALSRAKYKSIEVCVKKITLNDGTEVKYSKEWMDDLSIEDGDKLFAAINEVTNNIEKK